MLPYLVLGLIYLLSLGVGYKLGWLIDNAILKPSKRRKMRGYVYHPKINGYSGFCKPQTKELPNSIEPDFLLTTGEESLPELVSIFRDLQKTNTSEKIIQQHPHHPKCDPGNDNIVPERIRIGNISPRT